MECGGSHFRGTSKLVWAVPMTQSCAHFRLCGERDGRGKPRPYNEVRGVSYEDGWVRMRHFVGDSLWIRGSSERGGAET